jgi:putative addiction module CopG family antidote
MTRPITSADLPERFARFAEAEVAAGHFASVEDVVEAGLTLLQKRQERYALIDAALAKGETSGVAEEDVFERVRAELEAEPLPEDWNDYLRYRFEQGRAGSAQGDYAETPPAELMARIRARIEQNP